MTPVVILRQGGTNSTNKKHISPEFPMISPHIAKKYTSVIYWNMHISEWPSSRPLRKPKGGDQHYLNKKEVSYTILIVLKTRVRGAIKI